jgi:hypothetical protein
MAKETPFASFVTEVTGMDAANVILKRRNPPNITIIIADLKFLYNSNSGLLSKGFNLKMNLSD